MAKTVRFSPLVGVLRVLTMAHALSWAPLTPVAVQTCIPERAAKFSTPVARCRVKTEGGVLIREALLPANVQLLLLVRFTD